ADRTQLWPTFSLRFSLPGLTFQSSSEPFAQSAEKSSNSASRWVTLVSQPPTMASRPSGENDRDWTSYLPSEPTSLPVAISHAFTPLWAGAKTKRPSNENIAGWPPPLKSRISRPVFTSQSFNLLSEETTNRPSGENATPSSTPVCFNCCTIS